MSSACPNPAKTGPRSVHRLTVCPFSGRVFLIGRRDNCAKLSAFAKSCFSWQVVDSFVLIMSSFAATTIASYLFIFTIRPATSYD